jgi:hypothetical protein
MKKKKNKKKEKKRTKTKKQAKGKTKKKKQTKKKEKKPLRDEQCIPTSPGGKKCNVFHFATNGVSVVDHGDRWTRQEDESE